MYKLKLFTFFLITLFFLSCAGTNYITIGNGTGSSNDLRFNVKHVIGCCGCSGVLVNTFKANKLESQLFVESNGGCPFNKTKFKFSYDGKGAISKVDTLIAVSDSSFQYVITETDKLALLKVDSFVDAQSPTDRMYRLTKIAITGYRDKTNLDTEKLMLLAPVLTKKAVK